MIPADREVLAVRRDVHWAPQPNRVATVARGSLPEAPITAAHVFAVCGDAVLLVDVVARGWSPPGGRTEPGETPEAAARRELWEEAGVGVAPGQLELLGAWELEVLGPVPADHPYPTPRSAQVVYGLALTERLSASPVLTEEIARAAWFDRAQVAQLPGSEVWLPLLEPWWDRPRATEELWG